MVMGGVVIVQQKHFVHCTMESSGSNECDCDKYGITGSLGSQPVSNVHNGAKSPGEISFTDAGDFGYQNTCVPYIVHSNRIVFVT